MSEEKNADKVAIIVPDEVISSKIFVIRGEKVILDRDLAILYDVKAFRLREQVKRNSDIFPEHFMFQLNETETEIMVSQNAIPSKKEKPRTKKSHSF